MANDNKEQGEKLLQLVREAVQQDSQLREKFLVGDKFKFIRERLNTLLVRVEESLKEIQDKTAPKSEAITEDEMLVYVYLFNAQGLVFKSWEKMLTPTIFYEHSVNRPVYTEKAFVESYIRSKPSKQLHGFITIALKKTDVLPQPVGIEQPKDPIGNPIIKVREGSLKIERMISFYHNDHEYVRSPAGEIIKKV